KGAICHDLYSWRHKRKNILNISCKRQHFATKRNYKWVRSLFVYKRVIKQNILKKNNQDTLLLYICYTLCATFVQKAVKDKNAGLVNHPYKVFQFL
uniref:Uncharacterized protein n=1 Tax=Ciona savignyi TaxID=51511 RepID=H2YW52_CIOSA